MWKKVLKIFLVFVVLGMERRALPKPGTPTTELHPQKSTFLSYVFPNLPSASDVSYVG
jgi:hypothetical protein